MNSTRFISLSVRYVFLLSTLLYAANESEQQKTIVVVSSSVMTEYEMAVEGFLSTIEQSEIPLQTERVYYSENKSSQLAAAELLRELKPDLFFALGSSATRFVQELSEDAPLVYSMVLDYDPILATHRSRRYGISFDVDADIQFDHFRQAFPELKKLAILARADMDSAWLHSIQAKAKNYQIELIVGQFNSQYDIPELLDGLQKSSDMIWIYSNMETFGHSLMQYVLYYCFTHKFPVIGNSEKHVKLGAVYSVMADLFDVGKQAGLLTLQLFDTKVDDVQECVSPKKTKIYVNARMAKMLEIEFSKAVLEKADKIFSEKVVIVQ